jgi:hypothetical protein
LRIVVAIRWLLLVPYRRSRGDFRFELCPSVCLSVCLSVSQVNQFSALFLFMLSDIHLIFGTLLSHTKIQTKFEFGFDPSIFHGVMAVELRKISQILSFPHFYPSCFQIFIWYLVLCFAIPRYRSSFSLVLIHWFFSKLWPNGLRKISQILSFPHFFISCFQLFIWNLVHCFTIPRYIK